MEGDVTTAVEGVSVDGGAPLGAGGVAAGGQQTNPPAQNPAPPAGQPDPTNKVLSIPHSAMKRIKDEERAKGRDEAINALAKDAGFGSPLDLVQALSQLRQGGQATRPTTPQHTEPPAPQPTQPNPAADPANAGLSAEDLAAAKNARREQGKYERMIQNLTRERDSYAQKFQQANTQLKTFKEQLDSKDAEMALERVARTVGVTDTDYALRLYYREVEGKSAEELAAFDEKAFFSSLRTSRPYLFSEVVKPATTGTGPGTAPTAPKPGDVTRQTAQNGQFDAKKASPQEISERLRKMGLNPSH